MKKGSYNRRRTEIPVDVKVVDNEKASAEKILASCNLFLTNKRSSNNYSEKYKTKIVLYSRRKIMPSEYTRDVLIDLDKPIISNL